MTLSTYLYIHDPVVIPDMLAEARRTLALYDEDGRRPEDHIPLDTAVTVAGDPRALTEAELRPEAPGGPNGAPCTLRDRVPTGGG